MFHVELEEFREKPASVAFHQHVKAVNSLIRSVILNNVQVSVLVLILLVFY